MWNAGPSASEILFDAGRRKAQVEYAVAQRDQATALYREQVLSAFRRRRGPARRAARAGTGGRGAAAGGGCGEAKLFLL